MISEKSHQALASRALRRSWTGGRPYGYGLNQYGEPSRTGSILVVDEAQSAIVRRIFARHAEGTGCDTIARELNDEGVASPGSTWKGRKIRRCSGWMGSAVRVILKNPIYTGTVRWNTSKWERDLDDTDKKKRSERPKEEWERYTYQEERLRIVSDATWQAAQARIRKVVDPSIKLKLGGKPVYRLSGVLVCGVCGCNYVLDNATHYACSSAKTNACTNKMRQRRAEAESYILPVIEDGVLDPKMVALMSKEIVQEMNRRRAARERDAVNRPADLTALEARIARLKTRLRVGDPDMTADEVQLAITSAEAKRAELLAAQPEAKITARILTTLPQAAAAYRRQIAEGTDGNPRAAAKARAAIRQLLEDEKIRLVPDYEAGHLVAEFGLHRFALLRAAGASRDLGSGGRISHTPTRSRGLRINTL
jgi:site-specific DNA recombinase